MLSSPAVCLLFPNRSERLNTSMDEWFVFQICLVVSHLPATVPFLPTLFITFLRSIPALPQKVPSPVQVKLEPDAGINNANPQSKNGHLAVAVISWFALRH